MYTHVPALNGRSIASPALMLLLPYRNFRREMYTIMWTRYFMPIHSGRRIVSPSIQLAMWMNLLQILRATIYFLRLQGGPLEAVGTRGSNHRESMRKKAITCSRCHKKGNHNRLTCTETIDQDFMSKFFLRMTKKCNLDVF